MQELDAITLKLAIKGDQKAYKKLYDHYAPFIWKVLFPMSNRDMMIARELTQNTFVKAFRAADSFRGDSAYSTWLYRIAYSTAMEHFRKTRSLPATGTDPDLLGSTERSDSFDNRELVAKILATLSADDRFLIIAREVDAVSFEDLAEITGAKAGALRTRLHRLKETIRNAFPVEEVTAAGGYHG